MDMTKPVVPHDRYSAVDFFLQCCNPMEEKGIKLNSPAYNRMRDDPYLKMVSCTGNDEEWFGEEITIGGIYYPPLAYILRKKMDGYVVLKIKDGDTEYTYSEDELTVQISYN